MTPTYCISEIRVNDIYRLSCECAIYFVPSSSGTCTCKLTRIVNIKKTFLDFCFMHEEILYM